MTTGWEGLTLGRFKVEAEIGRGGMGVVYRGRQLSLNRAVAIKVLPPVLAADPQFRERFRQEAEIIAGLSHENIVGVFDIEEAQGTYFIVMELLDGESLRSLRERRRFSPAEVYGIGGALARALAYAHSRGIVHRDVKSQNVIITREGRVKLADFGIARLAGSLVKTQTGAVLGTPEYMAPEQARHGESSPKTDLYSLGVLLYELATGRLPFTGGDPFSIALRHISELPVPPRHHDPEIPENLERIILTAMAKDPAERFESASRLAEELESAGNIPARPSEVAPTLVRLPETATAPTVLKAPAVAAPPEGRTYVGSPLGGALRWVALAAGVAVLGIGLFWLVMLRSQVARKAEQAPVETAAMSPSSAATQLEATSAGTGAEPGEQPAEAGTNRPVPILPSSPETTTATSAESTSTRPSPARATRTEPEPQPSAPTEPEPIPTPAETAPEPQPAPVVRRPADYGCREGVEFHIDPEDADVWIDGGRIGIADQWDGIGIKGKVWRPGAGFYEACFTHPGYRRLCTTISVEAGMGEKVCEIELDLAEIDD
ncbi:MAG TPA: protein kinase [Thermoanaerobaculia bacterium]|nr:protein kinase [Thermoanaerobaculia bacterium]